MNAPGEIASPIRAALGLAPGLALCLALTLASVALQGAEARLFGRAWLEALVLAIVLGTAVRSLWTPGDRWRPGIEFSAKLLLEIAVVLLGASVSAATILAAGPALLVGIMAVVAIAICISYGLGRLFGLPSRMATLIACGNSICGNSAIAAVAPVIGADGDDVAASISFTAVLGVLVVLGLPVLGGLLHLSMHNYGVFAGLTVYAVPQVLAATLAVSPVSAQVGTLVKLVRVLMLGPVCLALSLLERRARREPEAAAPNVTAGDRPGRAGLPLHQLVPWFIVGFLLMAAARSLGWISQATLAPMAATATWLTILSMAALGLGVDVRVVGKAGLRVSLVVTLSLVTLGLISLLLIQLVGALGSTG